MITYEATGVDRMYRVKTPNKEMIPISGRQKSCDIITYLFYNTY